MRDDMCVLRAAFGDPAIALHPRIVRAARYRLVFHHGSIQQLRRFDVRPAPSQIWHRDHPNATLCRWVVSECTGLGEGKDRGRRFGGRKYKVAVFGCPACNLPIDHAFFEVVARNKFAANCKPAIRIRRAVYANFTK